MGNNLSIPEISTIESFKKSSGSVVNKPVVNKPVEEKKRFIKFIGPGYRNYGFEFKVGRMGGMEQSNSTKECGMDDIDFCTWDQAAGWVTHSRYMYVADVEIPTEAQVVHMYDKSKANMIDIKSIVPITEHPIWQYRDFAERVLNSRPGLLLQMKSIQVNMLTQRFVELHAKNLIGRQELTDLHYMWIAMAKPDLICNFPAKYKDSEDFWTELIKERPDAARCSPFLTMEQNKDLFFRPDYAGEVLRFNKETDSMRFLIAISCSGSRMKDYTNEEFLLLCKWRPTRATYIPRDRLTPEMTDLILASPYTSEHILLELPDAEKCVSTAYQQNKLGIAEKFGNRIADAVHAYIEKNQFLKKLVDANLLETIYGGFVREVAMCVLSGVNSLDDLFERIETYLDSADIDIVVTPKEVIDKSETRHGRRNRRIVRIAYDLTEVVGIVKQLNGAIEFYSSNYGEESPECQIEVMSAAAGTYVVWIPIEEVGPGCIGSKYRRYDLNIGVDILTNDTILNALTYDCAENRIEGLNNKGVLEVLQNRDIIPAEINQTWNEFGPTQGKMLIRFDKLFNRGYKVSKHFGLLYHLQILICKGFVTAHEKLFKEKSNQEFTIREWVNFDDGACCKKSDTNPSDCSFKVSTCINSSEHKMEQVTPKLILESLSPEFVTACKEAADEWHDDFSIMEKNAETYFMKQ